VYLCCMNSIRLSVVIITYNEAANIARCINSVREVADDIVVVDSYSTDDTMAICTMLGVRCIQHVFEGHIEQKNYALSKAQYPYVLSLDADECLSPLLIKSIKTTKQAWQADAYTISRLNNFCGHWVRHGAWYPDPKLRLWDRRKGQWGGKNPHDKVIMQANCRHKRLKGDLLHYSFSSIEQHIDQINRFSSIGAAVLYKQGKRATIYHIYMKPFIKFLLSFFIQGGFLDGYYGYIISKNSAHATFLKYVKLRMLWQQKQ